MRRALPAAMLAIVLLAAVPGGTEAAAGPVGAQASAPNPVYGTLSAVGCVVNKGFDIEGCTSAPALGDNAYAALSPDGHHLYVGSRNYNTITVFRRSASTGRLTRVGCVADADASDAPAGCVRVAGLSVPTSMVVSSDGRFLYVSAFSSNTVWAFARSTTTGLLTPVGCLGYLGASGCASVATLRAPLGLALSPDGTSLYVNAVDSDAVDVLHRDVATGLLTYASCAGPAASGCADAPVLRAPRWAALSADGRFVYVASSGTNALVAFARDPASGALTSIGCWSGTSIGIGHDARCSAAVAVGFPQFVTLSPDGRQVYTSAGSSIEDGGLAILQRDPTTGLLSQGAPETACVADWESLIDDCTRTLGFGAPIGIAFDPTGTNVYVGAYEPGTIGAYRRDPASGLLTRLGSCFTVDDSLAEGCEQREGLERAGLTLVSPDGRYVYLQAPSSGAIHVFGRRAVPADVRLRTSAVLLHKGKKFVMKLRCPGQASLGCFGLVRVRVLGNGGHTVGKGAKSRYDVAAGSRFKLRLRFDKASQQALKQTRHDVVQVDVVSREPGGTSVVNTSWLPVRTP